MTVYDADSGDVWWGFQHCRTDSSGSARLAYSKPRMLKVQMRHGSTHFPLKLRDGGEIFSSDIGYAVVEPLAPVVFAKALVEGVEVSNFAASTEHGSILAEDGIILLDPQLEAATLIATTGIIWKSVTWGNIDLTTANPGELAYVDCSNPATALVIEIENHERAMQAGIKLGVYGPDSSTWPRAYKWRSTDPRGRLAEIDGPTLRFDPMVPGYYTLFWMSGKQLSQPIKQIYFSGSQTEHLTFAGKHDLLANLKDADQLIEWLGIEQLGLGATVNGRTTWISESGEFSLAQLREELPTEIRLNGTQKSILAVTLPVSAEVRGDKVEFALRGMRYVKIVVPPVILDESYVGLEYFHPRVGTHVSVHRNKEMNAWRLVCPDGKDFSFVVTEGARGQRKRLRGFVYLHASDTAVYPELSGSMGTVEVGDLTTGVTLLAMDRTGDRYEMAHLLPNSSVELWLPALKPGEEFLVEGCTVTHDQINNQLVIGKEN